MNKVKITILSVLIAIFGIGSAQAAVNITATASVPNFPPEITLDMRELITANQEPWTGTSVSAMSFGELTNNLSGGGKAPGWYSTKYYCVFIFTNGFGKKYEVTSTATGLISGGNALPDNSFVVTPQYIGLDEFQWALPGGGVGKVAQGAMPAVAALGSVGSAVATNKVIYTSEPAPSTDRIIRAFYSLPTFNADGSKPFAGWEPIPLSQPNGNYGGTVTITISPI